MLFNRFRQRFQPALFQTLKEGYSGSQFLHDAIAGIIVGVVALPLAIAFAIASNVPPQAGIITAVIAGFIISAAGGSRVQIGGPTGAFIVIIYGIVQQFGFDGLVLATLLAGVMLIIMGGCGLGTIIQYIPYPVTLGFTAGIALIIFTGQINDILGMGIPDLPADFIGKLTAYAANIPRINPYAAGLSALTIAICLSWHRISARIPGSLIAIILTTLLTQLFNLESTPFGIVTIGSAFPEVSSGIHLPEFHFPEVTLERLRLLFPSAIAIAILAGIESLLSAVVADGMTGRRHNSNTELIGQGLANIITPLFGGIPATGAIARTATNIKNGGQTPVAGIIHAITLLLIVLFFGRYAGMIPMATLGGIVAVVAWNMSERHLVKSMLHSTGSDIAVMVTTFLLTVLIDLTVAIQAGVILAAFLFIRRMAESTSTRNITPFLSGESQDTDRPDDLVHIKSCIPPGVVVFEVYGALFFGAADKFKDTLLHRSKTLPQVLILRMRHVILLDATALRTLEEVYADVKKRGIQLILSGVCAQPFVLMNRSGFLAKIGTENVYGYIDEALQRARIIIDSEAKPQS